MRQKLLTRCKIEDYLNTLSHSIQVFGKIQQAKSTEEAFLAKSKITGKQLYEISFFHLTLLLNLKVCVHMSVWIFIVVINAFKFVFRRKSVTPTG